MCMHPPASKNRVAFGLTAGSTSTCPRRMRFLFSCSFFFNARIATAHDWPASTAATATRFQCSDRTNTGTNELSDCGPSSSVAPGASVPEFSVPLTTIPMPLTLNTSSMLNSAQRPGAPEPEPAAAAAPPPAAGSMLAA